jgi:hypothetical protein
VEEEDRGEVLKVLDAKGQILAYVLYEDEPIRRELMKRLTKDEARRIAANIASYWGRPGRHETYRLYRAGPACRRQSAPVWPWLASRDQARRL